jgi:hypothetical protein
MKIAAMTLMAALMAMAAEPKQPQQELTVYLRDNAAVPITVRAKALELANQMFATIGVRLGWRSGEPPRTSSTRPIGIELVAHTPVDLLPGALAYARPYEGVHIRVFYDRVERVVPGLSSVVLAHVLVHETTHILEGIYRHSDSGVMKAAWTKQDHLQMQVEALSFAPEDIKLIRLGVAARLAGRPALASAR